MRKIFFVFGIVALIFTANSCRTLSISSLEPPKKNVNLLPSLKPLLDEQSFASIFGSSTTSGRGTRGKESIKWTSTTYSNPRINEIATIFQRDVEGNICESYSDRKGHIRCKAIDGFNKFKREWTIPSVLFMWIPNLIGMPVSCWKTQLQIEVSIYDKNKKLIGRYKSQFRTQKTYGAVGWGYIYKDMEPRNVRLIFTKCMEDIKDQIAKDYNRLNQALK